MKTNYDLLTKPYEEEMLKSLKEFIAINSCYDESTRDSENPFGKGVSEALEFMKNLAIKDGFEATNYDNYVTEIIYGEGDKNITIMGHADIVPLGNGWETDPLEMVEKDGVLYSRGVSDDKGPVLACYYGLKALKDKGLLGDYQIRFLVGGNEERGSLCMEHYFHTLQKKQPTLGFTPDSDYPLIYAEKGIVNYKVKKDIKLDKIHSIKGGLASNAVIDDCEVMMERDDDFVIFLNNNGIKFKVDIYLDKQVLHFAGLSAHGSMPEEGINAGLIALKMIGQYYGYIKLCELAVKYNDPYGKSIDAYSYSSDMGRNSVNVGIINYENEKFEMVVNFRHVNTAAPDELIERIKKNNHPFEIEVLSVAPILFFEKNSVLVKTLLDVYQEETGDTKSEPLAIGGGTYAKEANNVVAFGMQFPGWDSKMHGPQERTKREHLVKSMAIYAHAIVELGKKL